MPPPGLGEKSVSEYRRKGLWAGRTLIDYAIEAAAAKPYTPVFLGADHVADFASLLSDAEALAVELWERGLRPGDVVSFQLPNWMEAAVINLAACRLGLICAPLVPIYRDAELLFMLNDSRCKVIFIPSVFRSFDFGEMYSRMREQLAIQPLLVTVRGSEGNGLRYDDLVAAGRGRTMNWPKVPPDAVKLLLYTSGTTGRPKAVLHNHETLGRAVRLSVAHWRIEPGDVVLMPSPVTHATGYANALELPFLHGTQTVLMDRWDPVQAIKLIDEYKVAATVGATPFLKELTAAAIAAKADLPSLRVFACGGAAVPPEVIHEANRVLYNKPAFRAYGSSEAPYIALGLPATIAPEYAATKDGQVVDYDIRIVDDSGNNLPLGKDGEIVVRGPALFLGYADAKDNEECFTPDGYYLTGDIGILGPDSWLTITGRKKDLIIRGGENISAKEIEDHLHGHPAIAEAAVVSMPHERLGEGVFAFVIARDRAEPALDSILAYLQESGLSKHKFPEKMATVTEFPRTPSGKIKKDVLRRMAADIVNQDLSKRREKQ